MTGFLGGYGTKDLDHTVRLAAFEFLTNQMRIHGETVARGVLAQGFQHHREVPRGKLA